jgi:methionyl aminopeptidase
MTFAIEPMLCAGSSDFVVDADGWTTRTVDGGLAAHWEYSIALIENGARVLGK